MTTSKKTFPVSRHLLKLLWFTSFNISLDHVLQSEFQCFQITPQPNQFQIFFSTNMPIALFLEKLSLLLSSSHVDADVHGRPTWRDRFSNLNQAPFPGPWNHAEVKATSQIAPRVVQKAPLLIRSGKYLICVCEGSLASMWFIRMSVVWRCEPCDARWTCILWGRASFCIRFLVPNYEQLPGLMLPLSKTLL